MKPVLMECGHVAQSIMNSKRPACVICHGSPEAITISTKELDLSNRKAKCAYGDKTVNSKLDLPFFKYRGEGSYDAIHKCVCGYYDTAHPNPRLKCKQFQPHGEYEYDEFYCGCHGWD